MAFREARSRVRGLDLVFVIRCVSIISVGRLDQVDATGCGERNLSQGFYSTSCPQAEFTIQDALHQQHFRDPSIAPALLRMLFHDCFVQGCDASILLNTTNPQIPAEKDASPNVNSLRGFEVLDMIKRKLEDTCPGVVSCADLIALAARESVFLTGGPRFAMPTGRRDSTISIAPNAQMELPQPDNDLNTITAKFRSKGLTEVDLVALTGAHTIGRSHCRFVRNLNLRRWIPQCSNLSAEVDLDLGSGRVFDNHYYYNVRRGRGLLRVDEDIRQSLRTYLTITAYELDINLFYAQFVQSLVKMSCIDVLTGVDGEVRRNCSFVNPPCPGSPNKNNLVIRDCHPH